ncbi:MAG: purine-nucleoside phosphorylase [Chitinophagales bacterium]
MTTSISIASIKEAAKSIQSQSQNFKPQFGIILGTGLGNLVNDIDIRYELPYADLPHFPVSTVESHKGKLILGYLKNKPIVAMQGRFHYYEGYTMEQVVFPVRVMKYLGIERLFISNAAGSLNPNMDAGDLMIVRDHINLQPANPLRGKNLDKLGVRFPDMSRPYNLEMIEAGMAIAEKHQIRCHSGVYVSVPGPNLETKAECKYLHLIGADAVGMSTVPEVIAAVHAQIPVFAISVLTNENYPPKRVKEVTVAEVIKVALKAEPKMTLVIKEMIGGM